MMKQQTGGVLALGIALLALLAADMALAAPRRTPRPRPPQSAAPQSPAPHAAGAKPANAGVITFPESHADDAVHPAKPKAVAPGSNGFTGGTDDGQSI